MYKIPIIPIFCMYLQKERLRKEGRIYPTKCMKKSKKKLIIILSVVFAVIILLAVLSMKACSSMVKKAQETVNGGAEVQTLQLQDLSSAISTTGTVESQTVVSVASDLTYKIKELPVHLGDRVEAGQTLCVFEDTELKQEIAELEKVISESKRLSSKQSEINRRALEDAKKAREDALAEAQANINSTKALYDTAKANYEAYGMEYYPEYTEAEANYKAAQNAYTQADRSTNATIQSCQDAIDTETSGGDSATAKQLAELKRKLEKTTVTAESSGIITSIRVNQGSVHAGGELMTIQDNTKMKVVVSLTETDVVKVKEGMIAEITANALEDEVISGTVSKVINFSTGSAAPNSEDGTAGASAGYSAEILIDAPGSLLLGMTAKVRIMQEQVGEVLAVSYDSIGTDEDGTSYVYQAVPEKGNTYKAKKVPVETGIEADYYTQITSDELSEGDYILSYPEMYSDGDTVTINPDFLEE